MDMFDSLFYPGCALNEQVAQQIFEILPENGPIVAIMDGKGNRWASDMEKFSALKIGDSFLDELCSKIDDGAEPVVTQVDDFSIIAAQLATEQTKCGYVIVVLPQYSPESTLINIDLIEMMLRQTNLVANLIEQNNQLCELQAKQIRPYGQYEATSN